MEKRRLGILIYRLNNIIGRFLNQITTPEESDLSCTNIRIIRFVSENTLRDVYQKDVEKEFGITRSTASRVLMLMEQKGLVERHGVKHDARLKKLVLTEKSQHLSDMMTERVHKLDDVLLKDFSDEEVKQLQGFLSRIADNVSSELN